MNIQSVAQLVAASTETPIWEVILLSLIHI